MYHHYFYNFLFVLGSKLKKGSTAQNTVYTALFSLIFSAISSVFTKDIVLIVFSSFWIIPFGIASSFGQKRPAIYKILINIGGVWFLLFLAFLLFQYIVLIPSFPSLSVPLILGFLSIYFIYRFNKKVFASAKKFSRKDFSELFYLITHLKKRVCASFLVPICIVFFIFLISEYTYLTISIQVLQTIYSTICGILSTLLGIMVTLTIFLLTATRLDNEIRDLLVRSVKALCILYGFAIIVSLIGFIFIPSTAISPNILTIELETILPQTIFFAAVGLFGACLSSLIVVFFEIVDRSSSAVIKGK